MEWSNGYCLGLTTRLHGSKSSELVIHTHTYEFRDLVSELITILLSSGAVPSHFQFSTIQVLVNPTVHPHRDKNKGKSITIGLGEYTGGDLIIDNVACSVHHRALLYDGSFEHYVDNYKGNRTSLTIFLNGKTSEAPIELLKELDNFGFHIQPFLEAKASTSERQDPDNTVRQKAVRSASAAHPSLHDRQRPTE